MSNLFAKTSSNMEREAFLRATGECQNRLEGILRSNAPLSLEERDQMEAVMSPLLVDGYFAMNNKVISPQEYYQGCTAILLARLLFQVGAGGLPSTPIEMLRACLLGVADKENTDSASSFLSLILDDDQNHPGLALKDWEHVLGLVSTIQSTVAVGKRRRQQKKWRLAASEQERSLRSLLSNLPTNKITQDSLEAMWVVPLSYIVGYVVYHSCRATQEQEGKTLVSSWNRDIRPRINDVLKAAFPKLRPIEYVDAGLMLLQLDLLQDTSNTSMAGVVTTAGIASDLMEE